MEIGNNFGKTLNDVTIGASGFVESKSLGQADFLKLMVEQLRNQNPLEPQDNSEFFSQIVQFDMLEAMNGISSAIQALVAFSELANASALVGRTVTAEVPQGPDPETGFARDPVVVVGAVERITFEVAGPVAHIDGVPVPLAFITEVA